MKPADLRDATWRDVLTHVTEDMQRVHLAYLAYGPGTTREVAQRSGISLLTLRPRTTDLHKLGLVELVGTRGSEGIYDHRTAEAAETSGAWRTRADFRRGAAAPASSGFPTVEAALASLSVPERVRLAAGILAQHGTRARRTEAPADQLSLAV